MAPTTAPLHPGKGKRYRPQGVKRVWIPKPDGRKRPLGIPTIRDRVAQMARLWIVEPIFEADFEDCSYGYRPGRSAHQALKEIRGYRNAGCQAVYDADLKGYFDSIPHPQWMAWEIDWYVRERLTQHLQRRSQRGFEFPKDRTIFQWFEEQGLIALSGCKARRHL